MADPTSFPQKIKLLLVRFPAVAISACAIIPVLGIAVSAQLFATSLRPKLPFGVDLNIFGALRHVAHLYAWGGNDSWAPMQRVLEVLHSPSGNKLYETIFFNEHLRFQYPLTSLLPLWVLNKAGLTTAPQLNTINLAVFLLNCVAVGIFGYVIAPSKPTGGAIAWSGDQRRTFAFAAGLSALLFYPLVRACVLGQVQVWIDLLFTCALLCWALQRRLCAGLIFGLAATIKPQFGLLLLWGALWREWSFVGGFMLGAVPFAAIAVALYGFHNNIYYLDVLSFLSKHGESFFANNSVNGILNWYLSGMDNLRWAGDRFPPYNRFVYLGTVAASVLFVLPLVLPPLMARSKKATLAHLGVASICIVISSPVAWEHHYGIMLPLFAVAICNTILGSNVNIKAAGVLFISWSLVATFIPFFLPLSGTAFALTQAHAFWGALLLLGVLLTGKSDVAGRAA